MRITAIPESFRLAETFTISRGSRDAAEVLTVEVNWQDATGRGECVPYARYGETMESVHAEVMSMASMLENMSRADADDFDLRDHMGPGAARNSLDCAIWDWRAKSAGQRIWEMMPELSVPKPLTTAYTLSLDTPENMAASAVKHAHRPLLKIKLGGEDDMARLEAVRAGAPDTAIVVDANEGWTAGVYSELAPHLVRLGVLLIEQPLPAGDDDLLAEIARPLPVCADESCHDRASLPALKGKYDVVNIKLDKTGGLSEALELKAAALAEGYDTMVGCMVGTSLAMAPAMLVAQDAAFVDLDGPLLLAEDRDPPLRYDAAGLHPPEARVWG
jgi:L-alanine-DL-glutamate epimerase-like enolase superfamily enzyme